ncbi:Carbohydrate-binding module family 50 protein [Lasiodiplodia theobromae]|uniref:Carbohydrate-binding module family 50 protein n=1 Tax=Lasiodiplodia theobromae TaxID=45133 RepID=UPI0015C3FEB2|nr:Carbohydrate-binding module family 50 protein [Lasiodiplodia theobromae]KAF4545498.1 Carbohydrate-binding module family 50 protein [Lasiodiplodia theobromae]
MADSIQLFPLGTFDSLSSGCAGALAASLSCPYLETDDTVYEASSNFTTDTLSSLCTDNCTQSIQQYRVDVESACGNETYSDSDMGVNSLALKPIAFADYYFNNYWQRCLTDSDGNFCYIKFLTGDAGSSGSLTCDECELKVLQTELKDPWRYDEDLAATYASLTSSCKVTDMPATSPPSVIVSSTSAPATTPTCTGKSVPIQNGDTCDSIAADNSISTWNLLASNGLDGGCANFPSNGTLCVESSCETYQVSANDTCSGIAEAHNITQTQLKTYNPQLNTKCSNIDQTVGHYICIGSPYGKVGSGDTTSRPVSTTTTPVAVPTDAAPGSNERCSRWHEVVEGDYCAYLTMRYSITLSDFYFLNPEVNSNCTNLELEKSYCVSAVGDISTYPGYTTATATDGSSAPTIPATSTISFGSWVNLDDLPTATQPVVSSPANTGFPLANGTRADCLTYDDNARGDVSCNIITDEYFVQQSIFLQWNPSLDTYNCILKNETRYCALLGNGYADLSPFTPAYASKPDNAAANSTEKCYDWWETADGEDCQYVLDSSSITIKYFYQWNPAVKDDCSNLWMETSYCVMGENWEEAQQAAVTLPVASQTPSATTTPNTTPTTTAATATCTGTTVKPPGATMTGTPCKCNKYAEREDGKYCYDLAQDNNITLDEFYKWNPGVGDDCQYLQSGYVYCVGVSS